MSSDQSPEATASGPVVALCGGVGAARFLRGLVRVLPPEQIVAIVNTGDDREFYGVHVSPDVDIVAYTLAGLVNTEVGYGLSGDTFQLIETLASLGHETWFRLGDRDFAHCLDRSLRLQAGQGLAEITDNLRKHLDLGLRILPMAETPCPTMVRLEDGRTMHFEEYMIREGAPDVVAAVELDQAAQAKPAPGVLEAIESARTILFCPSNPVVSVGPILAVPGIREAVAKRRGRAVAVSPIVGGAPVKGPARQLLKGVGIEVPARGVAQHYRAHRLARDANAAESVSLIDGFVLDEKDRAQTSDIESLGLEVAVTDSIMTDAAASERVARVTLELANRNPS